MADAVRAATHLQVFVALGPYPVEFIQLRETLGHESATDAMKHAIDLAANDIRQGRAVAFGEIGRPHFPVGEDIIRACNNLVVYAMAQAKSLECAVVLHTEDPTPTTFAEFAGMAARAGLDPKHLPHQDHLIASCQFVVPSFHPSSPLLPDAKTAEFSLRIGPQHLDRFDPCVGLGRLVPLDPRLNLGPIAFEDRLHTSIPSVLDVPVKSQRLRLLRTIRTKVDPLHASEKHDDRADLHRDAKRDDEKELYRGDWRFERRCREPLERRIQNPSIASDRTSNAPGPSSDGILSALLRDESDPGCRGITNDGRRSSWHPPRMRSTWERGAANCWQNFATRTADVRSPRSRGP